MDPKIAFDERQSACALFNIYEGKIKAAREKGAFFCIPSRKNIVDILRESNQINIKPQDFMQIKDLNMDFPVPFFCAIGNLVAGHAWKHILLWPSKVPRRFMPLICGDGGRTSQGVCGKILLYIISSIYN